MHMSDRQIYLPWTANGMCGAQFMYNIIEIIYSQIPSVFNKAKEVGEQHLCFFWYMDGAVFSITDAFWKTKWLVLHIEAWAKWLPFCRQLFRCNCSNWNNHIVFPFKFYWIVFPWLQVDKMSVLFQVMAWYQAIKITPCGIIRLQCIYQGYV